MAYVSKELQNPIVFYRNTVFENKTEKYLRECQIPICVQDNVGDFYELGTRKNVLEDENGKLHKGNLSIKLYAWRHKKR